MFLPCTCINNVNNTNPSKFVTGKDWDHARLAQSCTILVWCISAICRAHVVQSLLTVHITVEPRFNEPLFNEVLDIMNDILCPGQSYSKMYGIEPRYNEPRYNELFDITNIIRNAKHKIYLDITNYNVNTF